MQRVFLYKCFCLAIILFTCSKIIAQGKRESLKFGNVTAKDFAPTVYSIDSSADGIFLYDAGSTKFVGNTRGAFSTYTTIHTLIRLLTKKSFEDLATVEIPIYVGSGDIQQNITGFQANTYNIDNGKVEVTNVDKNSLFKDKEGKFQVEKFTFPNIKEGSIIEYTYTMITPVIEYIHPWDFQGKYPRLYSEYEVNIPEFYDFVSITNGYLPYYIDSATVSSDHYTIVSQNGTDADDFISIQANTLYHLWAIKDVPALKPEEYITTLDNYKSKVEFQLSAIRYPDEPVKKVMNNWVDESADLMKAEDFGLPLQNENGWLNNDLKAITINDKDQLSSAEKMYNYVRDNFSCTDYDATELSQTLKKTFETKKGNIADINLLLCAMLTNRGFDAKPVLLSTRDNGITSEIYPLMDKYNYVITRVIINDKTYLLDAANNYLGFGHLDESCYNGSGRLIDPVAPFIIPLSSDSIKDNTLTSVFIINGDKGLEGSYSSGLGYFKSQDLRQKLIKEKQDEYFSNIKKGFVDDADLANMSFDSLQNNDEKITVKYDINFKTSDDDIIYFNPLLSEAIKQNPFKSINRFYPVEMPYCIDNVYIFNMETPKGYVIDELPKSARVNLNEKDGMFEYLIGKTDDGVQLRCRLVLNKANFSPEDYQTLRDFYSFIVEKEGEEIVYKKSK